MAYRAARRRASRCSACRTCRSHSTAAELKVPWVLGLIATRSVDKPVLGIFELVARAPRSASAAACRRTRRCSVLRADPDDADRARRASRRTRPISVMGCSCCAYVDDPAKATPAQIEAAAWSTVPNVPVLFWSFRLMVGLGLFFIALFATAFYLSARHRFAAPSLVPADRVLQPAAAVDRGGAGLDRRRVRPAALGDRRSAAHVSGRIAGPRDQRGAVARRDSRSSIPRWPSWTCICWYA